MDRILLVDRQGRCKPTEAVSAEVLSVKEVEAADNRNCIDSLPPDFKPDDEWLERWQLLFDQPAVLDTKQFNERIAALKEKVGSEGTVTNMLAGSHLPVLLPKIVRGLSYGKMIETFILPVAERGYADVYPDREFENKCKAKMGGGIDIVDERHELLDNDLTQGPIPGILCFPFRGFSVDAMRQMARLLPDYMSLAGPIEVGSAMALYPKQMSRDADSPTIECAAVQFQDDGRSLSFESGDYWLSFCPGWHPSAAMSTTTGALFLRG